MQINKKVTPKHVHAHSQYTPTDTDSIQVPSELTIVHSNGDKRILRPKDNLTAIELYKIQMIIDTCKLNCVALNSKKVDFIFNLIDIYGISRHFDTE
ncbi:hypothetical protein UA38_03880 [Photobacterium kishitanii]|uniref:Uncharacterized protein n=1 Tax=Photobacterium kishitanii TaxID=318456 RepID=A0AAX0YXQ1_9GAMM|nr:hypothetical protein [Photobacterium kishitanii]KJG58898.1 hypothetical protein UA38_03880 [Photobacterium kishitanii]PSX20921.1 hypothetical protein C0W70_01415 [Photobacterium kishitanii]PSX28373.1 hypothetical protein C0W52_10515 [Photobacterium kishitanii]PSX35136.1 hypothetical protein C0W39_01415 [Photobacterium kishitanii]PSX45371.1 hypothetical protein C0W53_09085 [Photobacterium kishitanii]